MGKGLYLLRVGDFRREFGFWGPLWSATSLFMVVRLWVSPLLPVAPDTINNHVKTCREEQKNLHFFAPEYGGEAF